MKLLSKNLVTRVLGGCLLGVSGLAVNLAVATPIIFDAAEDLSAGAAEVHFESFESLENDTRTNQHSGFDLPGVQVSASAKKLAVFNRKSAGQAAVDGRQYVKYSSEAGGSTLTFSFTSPVDIFGLSVIDWGERGDGVLSLLAGKFGAVHGLTTPQVDGGVAFLGVQLTSPISWISLKHNLSQESWAFDGLYFGVSTNAIDTMNEASAAIVPEVTATAVSEPGVALLFGLPFLMCCLRRKFM